MEASHVCHHRTQRRRLRRRALLSGQGEGRHQRRLPQSLSPDAAAPATQRRQGQAPPRRLHRLRHISHCRPDRLDHGLEPYPLFFRLISVRVRLNLCVLMFVFGILVGFCLIVSFDAFGCSYDVLKV